MTEEEAKTKWCPHTRLGGHANGEAAGTTWNRWMSDKDPYEGSRCIGSQCMAWREVHPKLSREDHSGARDVMTKHAVETRRILRREGPQGSMGTFILDATGYCGLAGKPTP